jgi:hypothetical protein
MSLPEPKLYDRTKDEITLSEVERIAMTFDLIELQEDSARLICSEFARLHLKSDAHGPFTIQALKLPSRATGSPRAGDSLSFMGRTSTCEVR